MKQYLYTSLLVITACMLAGAKAWGQQAPPNIIFIVADDMGYGDSSPHNPDSKINLPNLARLANEGVTFTRAYTSTPKCAPSRYSFLSGNYHWRGFGYYGWWNYYGGSQIRHGQQTIANILQPDYTTSMVGKYHLGGNFYQQGSNTFMKWNDDPALTDFTRPMEDGARYAGFDYSFILLRGIQDPPYAYFENDMLASPVEDLIYWAAGWYNNNRSRLLKDGIGASDFDTSEEGTIFINAALAHLNQHISQPDPKPFFFYYPAIAAHHPTTPPDYFYGVPIRFSHFSQRADMLVQLDASLGLLLNFLDDNNLAANTLVIFTSDNGGPMDTRQHNIDNFGHDLNGGLRGGKAQIWDGGVRIPLVMRWGDGTPQGSVIPPGSVSDALIALQDIPASISAITGHSPGHDQMLDSYNLLGELLDPGNSGVSREEVVIHSLDGYGSQAGPLFAIIDEHWKLIVDSSYQPLLLFDMQNDRNETTDLLSTGLYVITADRLREKLLVLRSAGRTAPLADLVPRNYAPSGAPDILSSDQGIFVWGSDTDGTIEVVAKSAPNSPKISAMVLRSDRPFETASANSMEAHIDEFNWDGANTITFRSYSNGGADGFTAKLPKGASAVLRLGDDSELTTVKYGAQKELRGKQLILNNRRGVTAAIEPGMDGELIAGKPTLLGPDQGVFLWTEADDGSFEIAVKAALGQTVNADVDIIADSNFLEVSAVGLESTDNLQWLGGNRIRLTCNADDASDGFRAKLPMGSSFLAVAVGDGLDGNLAYGAQKAIASPNAWHQPLSQLSSDGSAESTRRLANLSITESTTTPGQVELRWRGDGSGTPFLVDLMFDGAIAQSTTTNPAVPYQHFTTSAKSVSASAFLLDEAGGIDINVPAASRLGFYFHNADGQIHDYLVNLPSGLGAPNAHRVKLAPPPGC